MGTVPVFDKFNLITLQACVQYLLDSFEWLAADGENFCRVSNDLNTSQIQGITSDIEILLCKARSVQNRYTRINKLPPEILAHIFRSLSKEFCPLAPVHVAERVHWPKITRVCRYWRRTALSTPDLWSVIEVPSGPQYAIAKPILSLSLMRSGVSPLNVHLRYDIDEVDSSLLTDLIANAPRIKDLRLFGVKESVLRLLSSSAKQLKHLLIYVNRDPHETSDAPALLDHSFQAPQLHSVLMKGCTLWQRTSFGQLRHLVLTDQLFSVTAVTALFNVLSSNASLEDLIIPDLRASSEELDDFRRLGHTLPRVEMLNLQRLHISQCERQLDSAETNLVTILLNSKIVAGRSGSWARYYNCQFRVEDPSIKPFATLFESCLHNSCPARKLCIESTKITATNGQSAFCVAIHRQFMCDALTHSVQASHVEELWLSVRFDNSLVEALRGMDQVTTLIIPGIAYEFSDLTLQNWLELISSASLFPGLKELRIMALSRTVERSLMQFLQCRSYAGQQLETLRFIKKPFTQEHDEAFYSWRSSSQKFAELADNVFFDEPPTYPRMELPPICTTSSPIHSEWRQWR